MFSRLVPAAAASLAAVVMLATPASAVPSLLDQARTQHTAAFTAADAATTAYGARDFDEVLAQAALVDAADAELERLLGLAEQAAGDADAAVVAAHKAFDAAQALVDAYQLQMYLVEQLVAAHEDAQQAESDQVTVVTNLELTLAATEMGFWFPGFCLPFEGTPLCSPDTWVPNPQYSMILGQLSAAQSLLAQKRQATADALLAANDARAVLMSMDDGVLARAQAEVDLMVALEALDAAYRERDAIAALHDEVHPLTADMRDRRLDIADVRDFEERAAFTVGGDVTGAVEGDTIRLTFGLVNPSLVEIQDAAVAVTSHAGLTPVCDPAGGVVAGGATLTCTVDYVVTAADAEAGTVSLTVELTGFLPLGPGNPRASAAVRTSVTVTETFAFAVAMAPAVTPAPVTTPTPETDGEATAVPTQVETLAATGAAPALPLTLATLMLVAGAALTLRRQRA